MYETRPSISGFTIDPPHAKDLDDGLHASGTHKNFTVDITISDVTAHIAQDSKLDREAYKKGFTRYGKNGATDPMFPREYSEGKMSLLTGEPRLGLTLSFDITNDQIKPPRIQRTKFTNLAQLDYKEADKILNGDSKLSPKLQSTMKLLKHAADLFMQQRKSNDAIVGYDIDGYKNYINENGDWEEIPEDQQSISHIIVNECMIKTNLEIARISSKLPHAFFRNHSTTKILDQYPTSAYYWPICHGHGGMGGQPYLHGTSPIRRYPDVISHRILLSLLEGSDHPYQLHQSEQMANYLNEVEKSL